MVPSTGVVSANGLDMHYLEAGRGAPLVLLHGFPDHAAAWHPLILRLATTFRVIAPDLRGYRQTRPAAHNHDYRLDTLVADIAGFLAALDLGHPVLCGHDWGGVLGFAFAQRHPERLAGLVALNAPPLEVLQHMIWCDPAQRTASQYIAFLCSADSDATFTPQNCEVLIERFLGEPWRQGLLSESEVALYREAWSRPGAWPAMLAWYRASLLDVPPAGPEPPTVRANVMAGPRVRCPVQLIWGDQDRVFVPAMPDNIMALCEDSHLHRLRRAGHMPHRDQPDRCASLITSFVNSRARLPRHKE